MMNSRRERARRREPRSLSDFLPLSAAEDKLNPGEVLSMKEEALMLLRLISK